MFFFDDAGYDYGVTRKRQNEMIDFCHKKDLSVFMNAWNIDDVAAEHSHLVPGDIYLSESFLVSNGQYLDLNAWKIKSDKCLFYQNELGIKIASVATATGVNIVVPT